MSQKPLVREIGDGCLCINSDGQGLGPLKNDFVVKANAPTGGYKNHGFDTAHLTRYDGTDFIQWVGRRSDGCFHAWGKLMQLTDDGRAALTQE